MQDDELKLKQAVERYINAKTEEQRADEQKNFAIHKAANAAAVLKQAECDLVSVGVPDGKAIRHLLVRADVILVLKKANTNTVGGTVEVINADRV